ncbi:ABC transporter substrate-binding protein [Haloferula sp. BvORR071]|uniref:ABC transporter substrate-binding protein n=1 Tax=Haloferula sp. BvORR071 TaxID=1396141 RepID=UPI0005540A9C|nr:ABC transporter substrate-binding protein [Haloferula sp. BvORR071]
MMRRFLPILLLLAAVIAAPILLRRNSELAAAGHAQDRLVIITPHNETIRSEFGEAFAAHWKAKTGRTLYIDWRIPGGTSDITRVLNSSFEAAEALAKKQNPGHEAEAVKKSGVGMDLFFGGGEPDFAGQMSKDRFVELEVFKTHPEWFKEDVIPAKFTGENYYNPKHLWVGTCLSQMGICYNADSVRRLGILPPRRWADLADPAYAGYVALADPTKSGSVTRMFEMMIQEQMKKRIVKGKEDDEAAKEEGWKNGINLLQAMAANARYFTDAASKIPHDVAQGDALAGTCIDFYGRSYEEKLGRRGPTRLLWIPPLGGTSISVDPIAVLRGAPHSEIAQEFVTFVLSDAGQLLWNYKAGAPGGPRETSPRRLPVRRDLYTVKNLPWFSDPDALPYERSGGFEYDAALTNSAFNVLRQVYRAMCMDTHQEMKEAWDLMRRNGGTLEEIAATPAGKVFFDTSHLGYSHVMKELVPLVGRKDNMAKLDISREMARISGIFRENYKKAAAMAREGGRP